MTVLCTIGYEGLTPDRFRDHLAANGVSMVLDVRELPLSRRPGFSKRGLAAFLDEGGIGYRHLRALGTPAAGRAANRAGRHGEMIRIFSAHMADPSAQAALHEAVELAAGARCCLLCVEHDHTHCHRAIVAAMMADIAPLELRHLRPA